MVGFCIPKVFSVSRCLCGESVLPKPLDNSADEYAVSTSTSSKSPAPHSLASSARYVARQPILTGDEKVFGYELLFRDGMENCFRGTDANAAALSTVDHSMLIGFDVLCGGRHAF